MSEIITQHKGTVHRRKDVKGIYGELYCFFKCKYNHITLQQKSQKE